MNYGERCDAHVRWWNGEYEGYCELPVGHEGPHFDGLSWFNNDNEEVNPSGSSDERPN